MLNTFCATSRGRTLQHKLVEIFLILAYSDSSRGERGRRKRKDAGEVTCKTTGSRRGHARPHELRGQGHRGGGVGRRPGHRGAAACSGERKAACSGGGSRLRAPAAARGCVLRRLEAACSGGGSRLRACVWREDDSD
jgi:hypothetical protein